MPLLEGLDGVEKMSKSKANYVGITDLPGEMFGKLMSISDGLMWKYFTLLSFRPMAEIDALRKSCEEGRNPRDVKVMLAQEIVTRFHSAELADRALADFDARFREGAIPENLPEVRVQGAPIGIAQLLKQAQLVPSTSEAMRNVEQGGVRLDGERVSDKALKVPEGTYVVQIGKRKFARVIVGA